MSMPAIFLSNLFLFSGSEGGIATCIISPLWKASSYVSHKDNNPVTPDKIIIFTNTIRKPAVIELDRIREVQFHVKDKVRLLLSDGKKKDINLIPMDANDEVLFIDTLKEVTKS